MNPGQKTSRRSRIASLGLALITAGVVAHTISVARQPEPISPPLALTPFTDPTEKITRLNDVTGTFATGDSPGDRTLIIDPDGQVRFQLIGPLEKALEVSDHYEIGLVNKKVMLSTARSGSIEPLDIDQLSFSGDVYRRKK